MLCYAACTAWPLGLHCAAQTPWPQDKLSQFIVKEETEDRSHLVPVIMPPVCPCHYLKVYKEFLMWISFLLKESPSIQMLTIDQQTWGDMRYSSPWTYLRQGLTEWNPSYHKRRPSLRLSEESECTHVHRTWQDAFQSPEGVGWWSCQATLHYIWELWLTYVRDGIPCQRTGCHSKNRSFRQSLLDKALLLSHEVQERVPLLSKFLLWVWLDPILAPDLINSSCTKQS